MNEQKVYGSSVLDQETETENTTKSFDDPTDDQVDAAREELKETSDSTPLEETVSVDAINGITTEENKPADLDELEGYLAHNDIRGRTLSSEGIEMIKNLIHMDPSEETLTHIGSEFGKYDTTEDIESLSSEEIKELLTPVITEAINGICDNEVEEMKVEKRFASQLFEYYKVDVEYVDDMKELTSITRNVKKYADELEVAKAEGTESLTNNLQNASDWINRYVSARSKLDERNKKLRPDYCIDDADARLYSDVREALDDALSCKSLNEYLDNCNDSVKISFFHEADRNAVVKNWISDLRNDRNVLYVFPVNDIEHIDAAKNKLVDFVYYAFLAHLYGKSVDLPADTTNDDAFEKFLIKNNICDKNALIYARKLSFALLYVISKTFKYKKLATAYNRRVLSYTLDMISKINETEYREKLISFAMRALSKFEEEKTR